MSSIDVRNEICSGPVLEVMKKLSSLSSTEILEVLADTSHKDDITRIFGKNLGHEILHVELKKEHVKILIKKK